MRHSDLSKILFLLCFLNFIQSECSNPYSYQYVRSQHQHREFLVEEGTRWFCLVFGVCTSIFQSPVDADKPGFTPVFQWSQLEFDYPTSQDRQHDIDNGIYIPRKAAPIDVDVYYAPDNKNKIFVTIPRFQPGSPIALGLVTDKKLHNNPIIAPYPSWSWHRNPELCNQDRIVSVYRVQIDECARLWVLDTGRINDQQTCAPQILAFDLRTNELVHRYEIPSNQIESRSILVTPIVDVRDPQLKCRDTFVYVADCQTYSIIVHDVRKQTSWRVTDKTMYPNPDFGTFNIQGDSFELMDGVLGMALEPYKGQDRKLFYHAMSSGTENFVYTYDLRNQSRFIHDPQSSPEIFHQFRGRRNTQSAAEAMDKNGIMFFGLMSDVTIDCWNTATEYGAPNLDVIANDRQTLQFASGVKVITTTRGVQEVWIMTSSFQKVATDHIRTDQINYRIQAAKVDDVLFYSKCKMGGGQSRPGMAGGQSQSGMGGGYGLIRPATYR